MSDPGIIFYFAKQVLAHRAEFCPKSKIFISFMEFSSNFKDLLAFTNASLVSRTTPLGSFVPGLVQTELLHFRQFLVLLKIALKNNIKRDVNKDMSNLNWMGNNKMEKSHFIIKFTICNYYSVV